MPPVLYDNIPVGRPSGHLGILKPAPWACALTLALLTGGLVPPSWADSDKEIISAEEIEIQKPASLMELLNHRVGLGSSSNQLSLRGVPGVALYVDGFSRGNSSAEVDKIKPQDVARIEILRGAASSRYGAEALGGAVVITTRQGAGSWSLDAVQGHNSLDSRYSRVIGNGSLGNAGVRLSFEDSFTNQWFVYDRHNSPFPSIVQVQDAFETKREGDFRTNYRNDGFNTAVTVDYIEQTRNYGRPNHHNTYNTLIAKWLTEAAFDELKLSANILYQDYRVDAFRDHGGLGTTGLALYTHGPENSLTFSSEFQATYGNLNLGLLHGNDWDFIEQRLAGSGQTTFQQTDTVDRLGIFGSYGLDFLTDWHVDLAGRYDRYEYFDVSVFTEGRLNREPATSLDTFNPKLSLSWKAMPRLNLHGSASTGFQPPSPSILYFRRDTPGSQFVPNRGLKPENSLTLDFGLNTEYGSGGKAGLTFFYTRWTDKIEGITTQTLSPEGNKIQVDTIKNLGEAEAKGVEFSLSQPITDTMSTSLNYTLNLTEITQHSTVAYIGNRLPFQPRHRINAVLDYKPPWEGTVRLNLHYESDQFMNIDNRALHDGGLWWNGDFATLDFLISRKLKWGKSSGLDLTFGINNLQDERYAKNFFERDVGRVIRGELAVHF
ncbi:MAG: TonB-dependent receptor [Methylococcaceae bacterium]|nr:TonB-dependent receptor [Methylococcaceae bacterium]